MSVDLDHVNIEQVNWAASQIVERYPHLPTRIGDMKAREADPWLRGLDAIIEDYLGIIGALRSGNRAWCDVQLASGRWVGRWFDDCAAEAALNCAYWFEEPVIAAGVGLKDSSAAADARAERAASGDLLVLLGDDW